MNAQKAIPVPSTRIRADIVFVSAPKLPLIIWTQWQGTVLDRGFGSRVRLPHWVALSNVVIQFLRGFGSARQCRNLRLNAELQGVAGIEMDQVFIRNLEG